MMDLQQEHPDIYDNLARMQVSYPDLHQIVESNSMFHLFHAHSGEVT
jgi:hypothetical protein